MESRDMIRVGTVSATNPEKNTVRVTFPDHDDLVSGELRILARGGAKNRDFWMPDVDDEVVCIFPTNDENFCDGFVIGTLFNEKFPPNSDSQEISRKDFSDGSFFQFNRETGELRVECKGKIIINAQEIYLNER